MSGNWSARKQGWGDPPATIVASRSGSRMVNRDISNVEAEDFIDGEDYSSDESINDFDIRNAAKRMKLKSQMKTHQFNYNYQDDPDDELDAILDSTSNHSDNVGSKDDDISEPEEIAKEYGVDLNHNAGKIVMKLVKK